MRSYRLTNTQERPPRKLSEGMHVGPDDLKLFTPTSAEEAEAWVASTDEEYNRGDYVEWDDFKHVMRRRYDSSYAYTGS